MNQHAPYSYWQEVWKQFSRHPLGLIALFVVILFCLMGIYAPFLASSKPLVVYFDGQWYFPLLRYLFYPRYFTKGIDLFYNLLMFTLPVFILAWWFIKPATARKIALSVILVFQFGFFLYLVNRLPQDPAASVSSNVERQKKIQEYIQAKSQLPFLASPTLPNWDEEVVEMTPYAKLNLVLRYQQRKAQEERLQPYAKAYAADAQKKGKDPHMPTLWQMDQKHRQEDVEREESIIQENQASYDQAKGIFTAMRQYCMESGPLLPWLMCDYLSYLPKEDRNFLFNAQHTVETYEMAQARLQYLQDKQKWLEQQTAQIRFEVMPLLRPFHWEDDAGGDQNLNRYISWWELTRINRKDMVSALIFGTRISLSVGLTAVGLALLIGIPIGALAGFYGGRVDIITYRLIEIWESMPTFFILLMVVALFQNKSIFLVVGVIGLFGWTGFSRFVRGEFFRQKQLPYVEACRALGFKDGYIMFSHLLPNAIPPLLTLVPFAIMGAITTEAGLSFLGLGEEGSSSWGVLMDEGRSAFPAESYLLWPPAILLTILLVAIALVGDSLRDALDPKLHTI